MKVRCEDCRFWIDSGTKKRDSRFIVSFSWTYRKVGVCSSEECAKNTSGYTGSASGHKMQRIGEIERYCQFFKPKEEKKHE